MNLTPDVDRRTLLAGAGAGGLAALMSAGTVSHGSGPGVAGTGGVADRIDWKRFLAGLDLHWGRVPRTFYEGPFLGNGTLGAAVYLVGKRVSFTLGHGQVRDHQSPGGTYSSTFANARLPIGRMELVTRGDVTDVDLRLHLRDAQLRGTITTTRGSVQVTAFVSSTTDVLAVTTTARGSEQVQWSFVPYPARSTRFDFRTDDLPAGLKENPKPRVSANRVVQKLAAGGSTTTAWAEVDDTLLLSVAHSYPQDTSGAAVDQALRGARNIRRLTRAHRTWWNEFYTKSFVSVPDGRIQSFYWIQLYKMASATRKDGAPIGTAAIWLEPTPWPATWWNLNVQLEYWMINATSHYELDSLTESIEKYQKNLVLNVPEKYRHDSSGISRTSQEDLRTLVLAEAGDTTAGNSQLEIANLTYAMHNVWLRYRHTMDDGLLRDLLFPVLKRAVNYMLHFITKGTDGKWHMPLTHSPEYANATDCNYTLSLLNWGCRTLLWSSKRLGVDDPLEERWKDVVANMVEPPQGKDGLWIGSDRQLSGSHRHYSHIMWFYPLYVLDPTEPANRSLLERSLAHWISFEGALQGYTFTGASSMSSMMGKGDDALHHLNRLLDGFVQPNTMYAETGPVIETPLSGAQAVHDMLISSWGDRIRIFPAAPSAWKDVSFHELRTEGAFLVSAERKNGRTRWIRVKSLAGEVCRIHPGNLPGSWEVVTPQGRPLTSTVKEGVITVALRRGQTAIIKPKGSKRPAAVKPVDSKRYQWGQPAIRRGASVPVPLTSVFNNDGASRAGNVADGDLTNGYTYPAEELPAAGPLRLGDVDWEFPSTEDGKKNNLIPAGQEVSVPTGRYARINVLGATIATTGTGGEFDELKPPPTPITATFADGSTQTLSLTLSLWDKQSSQRDDVAVQVSRRRSATRPDEPPINQAARIFHQWIDVDPSRELVSLTFQSNPNAHLFAVSVERSTRQ